MLLVVRSDGNGGVVYFEVVGSSTVRVGVGSGGGSGSGLQSSVGKGELFDDDGERREVRDNFFRRCDVRIGFSRLLIRIFRVRIGAYTLVVLLVVLVLVIASTLIQLCS